MTGKVHVRGSDIRGFGRLAVEATLGLAGVVETMHHNILRTPGIFGTATQQPARGITGLVYKTIRGVTRLVGGGVDALLGQLAPLIGKGDSSPEREAVLAALNGVLGDRLADAGNPLAIQMRLRRDGKPLQLTRAALAAAIPDARGKIVLLIHGLCMSDLQWRRNGHDHGAALVADGHATPVYLHYGSGVHISTNGRQCAALIEQLIDAWPVPVDELTILGHSMGGLVARSACHYAQLAGQSWLGHLRNLIFLGTPHLGAPLERGGNWIDAILDASPYTTAFARIGKVRSCGITDLRYGSMLDQDWQRRDRFVRTRHKLHAVSLPAGVRSHVIAASLAKKSGALRERLLGDGLVPLASALGQGAGARSLAIPKSRQWIGYGMNHLDLLDRREVYERIAACI